jgi:glucans biosynthesis protein C
MAPPPRLAFVDNLRAVVVLLVIVLHASICYMAYAPQWWYVVDPDQSLLFTGLVLLVDVGLMPAMFLAAGYFALPSMRRHGVDGFVRGKLVRIGIPWVVGAVVLAPMATYVTYLSRGIDVPYLQFWTRDFWGPMYQQSVYWFLGVLLALFLLLAWACAARPSLIERPAGPGPAPARVLAGLLAVTAAWTVLASPAFGIDDWYPLGWLLLVQPARVACYAGFFALGVHAERHGWFREGGYRPNAEAWIGGAVIAAMAYVAARLVALPDTAPGRSVEGVLFTVFCLAGVMAGLAAAARWANGTGRAWRIAATGSFGVYYVHPLVLYPIAWALVGVAVPAGLKWVVLIVATVTISLAVTHLVLRRVPGLRRVF